MRFSWNQGRGLVAVATALVALHGASAALAQQFVPYTGGQQSQPQHSQNPQSQAPQSQAYVQYQQQAQPHQAAQHYTAMAYQGSDSRVMSPPVESIAPGNVQGYAPAPAANYYPQPTTAPLGFQGYPSGASCGTYNTFDRGCGNGGVVGGGCGHGGCGHGGCGLGGGCGGCGTGGCASGDCCGLGGHFGAGHCGGCQWFGGFYGLYMERAGNPWRALAFSTPEGNPDGYYPTDDEFVLNLTHLDQDTFAGAEIRFGSTLGHGCGCGPRFGWEFGYWGLLQEDQTVIITDTAGDGNRLYTMLGQAGLQYDNDGAGPNAARPVNDYFEYGPPVNFAPPGDEIRIRQLTARQSFSAQNLELNFLRLPLSGGIANAGLGCCGCCSRLASTCLVGVRYFRFDEDFLFRSDFDNVTQGTTGFLSREVDVDNHLVGAQLGCNNCYRCGPCGRWALHCNSVVGVYGNRAEVWNRMDVPVGGAAQIQDGTNFDLRYEDSNVAVIGELRAGASYQYSCNWRMYGGYRLLGVSGVALAFDQIADQNITANQVQYVDMDGSLFLHGLQGGVEFTY